jgi:hypothetical protein
MRRVSLSVTRFVGLGGIQLQDELVKVGGESYKFLTGNLPRLQELIMPVSNLSQSISGCIDDVDDAAQYFAGSRYARVVAHQGASLLAVDVLMSRLDRG